jgi:nickel-dependent lactate racemase
MKTVQFLYGKGTMDLQVPDETPVLTSNIDALKSDKDGLTIVREALANPIDSPRLCELAAGKPDCTIIISDHTRPVPSQDILPPMIEELRKGNPDIKITLLVATGFHRPTTVEELRGKLGDALYEEVKDNIVVHDAGKTSSQIGGVIGIASGSNIMLDNCTNSGNIDSSCADIGGVVGQSVFSESNKANFIIKNCSNTGKKVSSQSILPLVGKGPYTVQ